MTAIDAKTVRMAAGSFMVAAAVWCRRGKDEYLRWKQLIKLEGNVTWVFQQRRDLHRWPQLIGRAFTNKIRPRVTFRKRSCCVGLRSEGTDAGLPSWWIQGGRERKVLILTGERNLLLLFMLISDNIRKVKSPYILYSVFFFILSYFTISVLLQ